MMEAGIIVELNEPTYAVVSFAGLESDAIILPMTLRDWYIKEESKSISLLSVMQSRF